MPEPGVTTHWYQLYTLPPLAGYLFRWLLRGCAPEGAERRIKM
jgi:hypothetical protein